MRYSLALKKRSGSVIWIFKINGKYSKTDFGPNVANTSKLKLITAQAEFQVSFFVTNE